MNDNKKLNYYRSAWNLSNPQLLTQTATSHIYTVTHDTETVILKLLSSSETEEQRGAAALRIGMDDIAEDFIQWHLNVALIIEPHIDLL